LPAATAVSSSAPITVPAAIATGIGLASAANIQISSSATWKGYEDIIVLAVLDDIAKRASNTNQTITSAQYTSIGNQVRSWLDGKKPANPVFADEAAVLRYAIDALVPLINANPVSPLMAPVIGELENTKLTGLTPALNPGRQYPGNLILSTVSVYAFQFIGDTAQDASDLAHNDPQFAAAVNPVLSDLLGVDSTTSYAQVASLFPNAVPTLPAPNSDGSFTVNPQDLITQYQTVISGVQSAVDSQLSNLESVLSSTAKASAHAVHAQAASAQDATSGCTAGTPTTQAGCGCTAGEIQVTENCVPLPSGSSGSGGGGGGSNKPDLQQEAKSAVDGLSKLVGLSDPTVASQISTVGGAVIQSAQALNQLGVFGSGAGALLGTLGPALGALGPIGALAGAGVTIFSSLFGGSSSPNAAVLAQIQVLKQQIARLQQDMDAQFAVVDAQLNTILKTLNTNFALINYQLGTLSGDINAIQASLLDVETQLNQLAVYSLAFAQTQEYETMIQNLNACLNYRTVHNGADIGQQPYNTCENALYTAATSQASDQIWAGLQNPSFADSALYNLFENNNVTGVCAGCASPFSILVNFLAGYPAASLNLPALASTRLPNPDIWNLMARSYLQLAREWPGYTATINSSRLNDVIQQGQNLRQAMHAANSSATGATIAPNPTIFNALVNKYKSAVSGVQSAAQADLNSYVANPANGVTNPSTGISLSLFAGGVNQKTSWRPPISSFSLCGGSTVGVAPSNLLSSAPDLYAFAQGYLSSGQLSMCISQVQWTNLHNVQPYGGGYGCKVGDVSFQMGVPPNEVYVGYTDGEGFYPQSRYFAEFTSCLAGTLSVTIALGFNGTNILSYTGTQDAVAGFSYDIVSGFNNVTNKTFGPMDPISFLLANWTATGDWRSNGLNLSQRLNTSYQASPSPQPQLLASIAAQLDSVAQKHQQNVYKNIAADFGVASAVQSAGQFLTATKLLTQAYASLGLPSSLQTNDVFRAALYGTGGLEDAAAVQLDFSAYAASSIPDTTDNKLADEIALLNSEATALATALSSVFTNIQNSQTPDSLQQIDTTIQDLQSLQTLKNASSLAQCNYQLSTPILLANPAGNTTNIGMQVEPGCAWKTNTFSSSWVSVSSGQGSGNGTATLSFSPNTTGNARAAVIVMGEQILRVVQGAAAAGSLPPAAPILTAPADGATGISLTPTLSWNVASFASTYSVYLGTGSSLALVATVNGTSYTPQALSPGTAYSWKVVANDTAGSTSSAVATFTTQAVPPQAPVLVSPASGATGVSLTPTLAWEVSNGPTSYAVYLGTSSSPPQVATVTSTSFSPPSLTAGTTYYWRVAATNSAGSTTSSTFTFTTQPAAPAAPVLSSPANGATGVPVTQALSWNAVAGATSYSISLGTSPNPPVVATSTTTSYAPSSLAAGTTYYWKVAASASSGSATSATWSFTTASSAPAGPVLSSPANGATGVPITQALSWNAVAGATSYSISLGTSSSPPVVATSTTTSYAPSWLAAGTTYYWKIAAATPSGSASSATWSFTTASASTSGLTITTPSVLPPGTVGSPYSGALDATGGAGSYQWSVSRGSLPQGVNLVSFGGVLSGLLEGTPSAAGTSTFTVKVSDSSGASITKQFTLTITGTIIVNSILNAASYAGGAVSPGEIAVIFGSGMGPNTIAGLTVDSSGHVTTLAGGTSVLFDGIAAPMVYSLAGQVSAIVPYEVAGKSVTQVVVSYQGQTSAPLTVPVAAAVPGIFTISASGSGQGAILNQNGTVNGPNNPAPVGSYVFVFATGEGQTNPAGMDGSLDGFPAPNPILPVTATIGGVDATVQYVGGAPSLVAGVLQVNLKVPQGVKSGGSVPIVINIGGVASQANVTLAVQ
jgi:uncharacterized protein (TIGR03437 family)